MKIRKIMIKLWQKKMNKEIQLSNIIVTRKADMKMIFL